MMQVYSHIKFQQISTKSFPQLWIIESLGDYQKKIIV